MLFYADHKWKLIDFDAAAVHSRRSQISTTVYYAAPEILENEEIGKKDIVLEPSVDMFSFGIIFFEVLTGPFSMTKAFLSKIYSFRSSILWSRSKTGNNQ